MTVRTGPAPRAADWGQIFVAVLFVWVGILAGARFVAYVVGHGLLADLPHSSWQLFWALCTILRTLILAWGCLCVNRLPGRERSFRTLIRVVFAQALVEMVGGAAAVPGWSVPHISKTVWLLGGLFDSVVVPVFVVGWLRRVQGAGRLLMGELFTLAAPGVWLVSGLIASCF